MKKKVVDYKKLTPAQIGRIHENSAKSYFFCSYIKESEINWMALWVRDEVRKAIRKERGLK